MKYNSVLDTIGNTPIIRINRLAPKHVQLYVKTESRNPGGSVKDRLAYAVINDAEKRGLLKPGQTVVEATSGNTGIALAMVCAAKGYPFVAVMTETFSVERRKLIRSFGGKVILTPAAERGVGMVRVAKELAEKNGWFLADQFANPANPAVHERTTGEEIWQDTEGDVDYLVSGVGTGGTITGTGSALRRHKPGVKLVAVEPAESPLLSEGTAGPHKIQGLGANFVPDVLDTDLYDEVIAVPSETAIATARRAATEEGLLVGISSGAALAAAVEVAQRPEAEGKTIVAIVPDFGERYLSTPLFAGLVD